MEYAVVVIAALLISPIALYSGFGLGTLLMPVFAIFFPLQIAVASTAAVHLANNVFRVAFVGRSANFRVVLAFGLPAAAFAILGAFLLVRTSEIEPLVTYNLFQREMVVTIIKLVIAVLIIGFAVFDLLPLSKRVGVPMALISAGGALSGFFGGLSGHQGELRTAVLSRLGMQTATFIGTVSLCALVVDISRLTVYGTSFLAEDFAEVSEGKGIGLVGAAIVAAFVGTAFSSRLLKYVTMAVLRRIIRVMLIVMGVTLGTGLV